MKKVNFSGKLNLNKETVTRLNDDQMRDINGAYHIPSNIENGGGSMAWAVGTHNTCNCEGFSCNNGIASRVKGY
jgi:hypothetical protein